MKIICSACLLGINCKYNGKNNALKALMDLEKDHEVIPVCPEVLGGLPTPRTPSEKQGNRIISADGADVTGNFEQGAQIALEKVLEEQPDLVVLMDRSPSCGLDRIYDGSFEGKLVSGDGVFAGELKKRHIKCISASKFQCCIDDGLDLK